MPATSLGATAKTEILPPMLSRRRLFHTAGALLLTHALPLHAMSSDRPVVKKVRTAPPQKEAAAKPAALPAGKAGIVVDQSSGTVVEAYNADVSLQPASLTKLMTAYLTFAALREGEKLPADAPLAPGQLRLDTELKISAKAARQEKSKLYLKAGSTMAVRDGLRGIIGPSANDAAMVLAEGVAGSEAAFVAQMNAKAKEFGMSGTTYTNPSGLEDARQRSTVRDTAILMQRLRTDFPEYYPLFKDPVFFAPEGWRYNGQTHYSRAMTFGLDPDIKAKPQPGSHLYPGIEAAKSGYLSSAGCNMAANALRDNRLVTAVVIGFENGIARFKEMTRLLDAGFAAPQLSPTRPASAASAASAALTNSAGLAN